MTWFEMIVEIAPSFSTHRSSVACFAASGPLAPLCPLRWSVRCGCKCGCRPGRAWSSAVARPFLDRLSAKVQRTHRITHLEKTSKAISLETNSFSRHNSHATFGTALTPFAKVAPFVYRLVFVIVVIISIIVISIVIVISICYITPIAPAVVTFTKVEIIISIFISIAVPIVVPIVVSIVVSI